MDKADPEERVLRYLHEDVQRKQIRNEPRKIRSVVSELLTRRGYAQVNSAEQCVEIWGAIVGPSLARISRPTRVRQRVLHVMVASSVGIQELTMRKQNILKKLAKEAPELNVVGLKFRVGTLD